MFWVESGEMASSQGFGWMEQSTLVPHCQTARYSWAQPFSTHVT